MRTLFFDNDFGGAVRVCGIPGGRRKPSPQRRDSIGPTGMDEPWLLARPTGPPRTVPQVMFMRSRRRRTDFCGSGRCRASVVGPRYVVRMLEVCLFLALACSYCAAFDSDRTIAQFAHTTWGPKEGAPSAITALAQSVDGYLWLGSHDGLYRFDGVVFERYQPQSGGPFPAQDVTSLLALPNGDLWIGF